MATATLVERGWLKRGFEVSLDEVGQRPYFVTYRGRGIGNESVLVDGMVTAFYRSFLWFVPQLPFRIGSHEGVIDVRVWPWLAIRSIRLSIDGETLYSEGD